MRAVAAAGFALTLPLLTSSSAVSSASEARCAAELARGFVASFAAEARGAEACLRDGGGAALEACLDADRGGHVARAQAHALAAEGRACSGLPAFGAAGAGTANAAAAALERALLRGLFGRRPLEPADAAGAHCRHRVLGAANACAAARLAGFARCADAARRGGVDDAFDLLPCKGEEFGGACSEPLARAAAACDALDASALLPGCASEVASCARATTRHAVSTAQNEAAALCQEVLPGSLDEPTLLQCFEPPPPEPVAFRVVPLPAGVNPVTVEWDEEASELLIVSFTAADVTGTQLASVRSDGSGFRCLSCGAAIAGNLRPVQRLRDGRRVLVAGPNNANPRWNVLECTPSLLDCQTSELVPIELPPNPDPTTLILQYRVPWVTLDDGWLIWSEVRLRGPGGNLSALGRLVRGPDRYVVTDARVVVPPLRSLDLGANSELWRSFTQPFEAKFGALRGGRDWFEAGTPSAGQYDTSVIDLASGEMRRLTHHPDHDEGIRFTRDEQWAVLQSARTDNRVEFLGLLPRPPYIDWSAFSLHFVAIAGAPSDGLAPGGDPDERDCYVDPWLVDRWFERGDYLGQRLLRPADGWVSIEGNAGGFGWSPDGTRIALVERRSRHGPAGQTRLSIATLPNRAPIEPGRVVPIVPTPEPDWAIRYEDWIVPDTRGVTVIAGRVAGTATLTNELATALAGRLRVDYAGYSDDGVHFLDGFERVRIPFITLGAEYEVDLVRSGPEPGTMRGLVFYDFVTDVNRGLVTTEWKGRRLEGPKTCEEAGLIQAP